MSPRQLAWLLVCEHYEVRSRAARRRLKRPERLLADALASVSGDARSWAWWKMNREEREAMRAAIRIAGRAEERAV